MDLQLKKQTFCVGGVTSGLGRAVAVRLLAEGASVIGVARGQEKLDAMAEEVGERFTPYSADLTDATAVKILGEHLVTAAAPRCLLTAGRRPTGRLELLDMTT